MNSTLANEPGIDMTNFVNNYAQIIFAHVSVHLKANRYYESAKKRWRSCTVAVCNVI